MTCEDVFVRGMDELHCRIFKMWCVRNRIPYNVALEMFVDLTLKRVNWTLGFGRQDPFLDTLLKEKLETDPRLAHYLRMSPIQRYFGNLLKPIVAEDIKAIQAEMQAEAEAEAQKAEARDE